MTVTHRKTVESATQGEQEMKHSDCRMSLTIRIVPAVAAVPVTEPGISYECDSCDSDITHTIRIKCAAHGCEEIDLCVSCFTAGKEVGEHKAWHDYRVVVRPSPFIGRSVNEWTHLWYRNNIRILYLPRTGAPTSEHCAYISALCAADNC